MPEFTPTRDAGLARLRAVSAMLGRDYAAGRNTDRGADAPQPSTSALSPWLRHGLVLDEEAIRAALSAHGTQGAGKFVEEVAWRAYFKGWLEGRPAVWDAYRSQVRRDRDRLATESGLRRVHDDACAGRTGITCFDDWARELAERGWLHNHARMWFASIWIFTLRLPWSLGADLFLRHLLDGDPASNTLSWRWAGGLHTRGKHYVARAENIARYTEGRYDPVGQLDETPAPLPPDEVPPHRLPPPPPPESRPRGRVALLLHEDDLALDGLDLGGAEVAAVAGFSARAGTAVGGCAEPVAAFARAGLEDALRRAEERFGLSASRLEPDALTGWTDLPVVTPHAPVGPAAAALSAAEAAGLPVFRLLRPWHAEAWPHAGRGFFQIKARLPELLAASGVAA